ncbi:MAG: (2Fe-2S)-binding protein [Deltaproteobacteria bacterium]|nr:(2Fe-2S)-binding protein [Deltaproteobacteria bacterium]
MTLSAQSVSESAAVMVGIRFNGNPVKVRQGVTILEAARQNGVRIPALCFLQGTEAFGGCRICLVEIEGRPGFHASCVLRVEARDEGMNVLTDTDAVKAIRKEMLKLLLSEHPSGCLLCNEGPQCRESMLTISKSGHTTGCRFCSNDGDCELQRLVEEFNIKQEGGIGFSVRYRGIAVEREEPFYDRDYNLCVLCGRCVRVCREIGADVLSFVKRGPNTLIGAGMESTHLEAGCWFCGTCVLACPTGALADRQGKWDRATESRLTTCQLCDLGCEMQLDLRDGEVVRATPKVTGRVCAKGRFGLPGLISGPSRLYSPLARRKGVYAVISWEEAFKIAAERISAAASPGGGGFSLLAAPELMAEAKRLLSALNATGGQATLDTSARLAVGGAAALASEFKRGAEAVSAIDRAQVVLMVAAEPRYSHTPLWVGVRRAQRRGAKLVVIDAKRTRLARLADEYVETRAGGEAEALYAIASALDNQGDCSDGGQSGAVGDALQRAAALLSSGRLAAIVGATPLQYSNTAIYVEALRNLGKKGDLVGYLFPATDTAALKAYSTGAGAPAESGPALKITDLICGRAKPAVLYLAADVPFAKRPECGFLIAQDSMQLPEQLEADLVLPATPFGDQATNGSEQGAKSDRAVFAGVIEALGKASQADKSELIESSELAETSEQARAIARAAGQTEGGGAMMLVREISPLSFRGFSLDRVLVGFGNLGLSGLRIHPEQAARLGLQTGDEISLLRDGAEIRGRVVLDRTIPRDAVYAVVDPASAIPFPFVPGPFAANPCAVEIKRVRPSVNDGQDARR